MGNKATTRVAAEKGGDDKAYVREHWVVGGAMLERRGGLESDISRKQENDAMVRS